MNSLFKKYPNLKDKLPYIALGDFPTPVRKLKKITREISPSNNVNLYVKEDNLTGKLYGGNKVRKLEFLLADALKQKKKSVLTFGAIGSNHALATALYSRKVGLNSNLLLVPQEITEHVLLNLKTSALTGANLYLYDHFNKLDFGSKIVSFKNFIKTGKRPYLIPAGGTSPVGILGYVNAGLELAEQIAKGDIPEPHEIYLPLGTGGTVTGLILGLLAANVKSHVTAVLVVDKEFRNYSHIEEFFNQTLSLLRSYDKSFPELNFSDCHFTIDESFLGDGYGSPTEKGRSAIEYFSEYEDIYLENTYTGKTAAAIISHSKEGLLSGKDILYWNTLNSVDLPVSNNFDYNTMPQKFHKFFK